MHNNYSINQINTACEEMLTIVSTDMGSMSNYTVNYLKESLAKLNSTFEETPEDTMKIYYLKSEVEHAALDVEYQYHSKFSELNTKYKKRSEILDFVTWSIMVIKELSKLETDNEESIRLLSYFKDVTSLKEQCSHIILELSEGDEELMHLIKVDLDILLEKYRQEGSK